jgi:hypothetical protein
VGARANLEKRKKSFAFQLIATPTELSWLPQYHVKVSNRFAVWTSV